MMMMTDTLQFGQPKAWAYPTVGMLQATGTPLPEQIRVLVYGRLDHRIAIDETLLINEDETKNDLVVAALAQAGDYNIEDFVETYVTIADGRANVVGYVLTEERITEHITAWSDDTDEEILDAFIVEHVIVQDYGDFDLYLQRGTT